MLEEFMNFEGEKMPSGEGGTPQYIWKMRLEKPLKKSVYSKYSKLNLESLKQELSIADRIMQRQMEEKARLEEKKQKILKELNKKKRINLTKFLTSQTGYEQKKIYDLEQKRFKELEQENQKYKDRPKISQKTIEIYNNSKKKKKPIYLRTNEILKNKKKNIENLNIKIKNEINSNKLNKSMDEINTSEYIVNNEIKNKKMTKKQMIEYYNNQKDWKNKINESRAEEYLIKNEKEQNKNRALFHPKISRGTKEIISAMNEAKENYLYPIENSKNNNLYLSDLSPNPNYINYDNDVFKRLYENKKLEKLDKYTLAFQPITNKNKYKKILPKYKDILNKSVENKKIKKKKSKKKVKSVDKIYMNKNRKNEVIIFKNGNGINDSWVTRLSRLKKNKSSDKSYKLNIRQCTAWNENVINIVPFKGKSREVINYFI